MIKMKKLIIFIVCLVFCLSSYSDINIETGSKHRDLTSFPTSDKFKVWDLEEAAALKGISALDSIVSYVTDTTTELNYVLGRELHLGEIDSAKKVLIRDWPLVRWGDLFYPPQIPVDLTINNHSEIKFFPKNPSLGCLSNSPLRYGDVEGDSQNE